jgi:hypothetical protein
MSDWEKKISLGVLIVGGVVFLEGMMVLGYTPGTFVVAAGFFFVAAMVGSKWLLRGVAVVFCAASIAMAIHHTNKREQMAVRMKRMREQAAKTAIPNDANGDVLRRMVAAGDDLSKARDVEFHFVFDEERKAKMFAKTIEVASQARAEVTQDEQRGWSATVRTNFAPTHAKVSSLEAMLTQVAEKFEGKADGWGSVQL